MRARKRLHLKIPRGVDTGSRLRLGGKGDGGSQGGPAGDLYVVLHVRAHELFERRGDDLYCEVPVPFDVAALGGEIEVPTIDGYAKLKLAPGTENGKVFRLRGRGMPDVEGYGRGAMHVRVVIEVPARLNAAQKKILREFTEKSDLSDYPRLNAMREMAAQFYERKQAIRH